MENAFFAASACHLLSINELHRGRLGAAQAECAAALAIPARSGSRLFYAASLAVSGAIHARRGKFRQAGRDLYRALGIFRRIGAAQQEANARLALAALLQAGKKTEESRRHLSAAFTLGEERGFVHYYLFTPRETSIFARTAVENNICAEYSAKLAGAGCAAACEPSINICCLGGFRVVRGKTEVSDGEWKSRKAKKLIKLLVAREGSATTSDAAIDELWAGSGGARAFSSLLYRLRRLLDAGGNGSCLGPAVTQEGSLVMLNPRRVWTDTGDFRSRLAAAKRQRAAGDPAGALKEYEGALALYKGDFLPEDLYEDWSEKARDSLRNAFLAALHDVAAIAESLGDKDRAAAAHDRMLHADPCNERSCRWLMAWHAESGRRADALRIYDRCERALSRELDAPPERLTAVLYREIISGA